MAKFCGKCGTKLDESNGLCPNCDAEKNSNESASSTDVTNENQYGDSKSKKQEAKKLGKEKKKRIFPRLFFGIIIVVILAVVAIGTLVYMDIVDIPVFKDLMKTIGIEKTDNNNYKDVNYDDYKIEPQNADEYFQQNSNLIEDISVNDSDVVFTEKEATEFFVGRGFEGFPIMAEYDMDGVYYDPIEVSKESYDKHPIYTMYYATENNELWNLMLINNSIMAIPVSYNVQMAQPVQVVLSEQEMVTSYDSTTNKFYLNIPDDSVMIVKVVERIDAETLEKLTIEGIEGL